MEAKYWLALLLVASFLVRAPYITAGAPLDWDAAAYAGNAEFLLGRGNYFEEIRPPMLPLMLVPFAAAGVVDWAPAVLGVLSLLAAYLLFKEIAGRDSALTATAILSLSGLLYSWTTQIAVENGIVLVLSLLFLLFIKAAKDGKWLLPAFAMAGVAVLFRYYFAIAALFGMGYLYWERRSVKGWAIGLLLVGAMLAPWLGMSWLNYGDPFHTVTEATTVFALDLPNFKPVGFYLQNWWQIADIATWALLLAGLAMWRGFSRIEWLLAAWLLANVVFVHLSGVKEARYFVPMLLPMAYFASRPLRDKRLRAAALIAIAIGGLGAMGYAFTHHAPDPCMHHTGVALASAGLEGTVFSTHWTIAAYYSKQPVEKLWYGKTAEEFEQSLARSRWVVYSDNGDPDWAKERLDARGDLRLVGAFGPECSQAFLYEVVQ